MRLMESPQDSNAIDILIQPSQFNTLGKKKSKYTYYH